MRKILYIIILALSFFAPVQRLDIAKLLPVESVAVYMERGQVLLKTDTDNVGRGSTAPEALQNLKDTTAAIIYLDTADYLLIGEGEEAAAEQLRPYLRPSVRTGHYAGGDVKEETRYLDAHQNSAKPKG